SYCKDFLGGNGSKHSISAGRLGTKESVGCRNAPGQERPNTDGLDNSGACTRMAGFRRRKPQLVKPSPGGPGKRCVISGRMNMSESRQVVLPRHRQPTTIGSNISGVEKWRAS